VSLQQLEGLPVWVLAIMMLSTTEVTMMEVSIMVHNRDLFEVSASIPHEHHPGGWPKQPKMTFSSTASAKLPSRLRRRIKNPGMPKHHEGAANEKIRIGSVIWT
jgi:hypothetical protein